MYSTMRQMPQSPGPLAPWVRGQMGQDMSEYAQRGREAFMKRAPEVERMLADNAATVCIAGLVLGTFVDRRFYLLPLAIGGMKLWRSMQS